jgi:hypothetical protein
MHAVAVLQDTLDSSLVFSPAALGAGWITQPLAFHCSVNGALDAPWL